MQRALVSTVGAANIVLLGIAALAVQLDALAIALAMTASLALGVIWVRYGFRRAHTGMAVRKGRDRLEHGLGASAEPDSLDPRPALPEYVLVPLGHPHSDGDMR